MNESGFVRAFFAEVEAQDETEAPEYLGNSAQALFRLGTGRRAGADVVLVEHTPRYADGTGSPHTLVYVVTDDEPFVADSITAALVALGYDVHRVVDVRSAGEAWLHVEIDRETDAERLDAIWSTLNGVLGDVRVVVDDWVLLVERARACAAELRARPPATVAPDDVAEAATFLEWLAGDNFTFQAYCEYERVQLEGEEGLRLVPGSELGVLRRRQLPPLSAAFATMSAETRRRAFEPGVLTLTKAQARSTVHRRVPLDYVGVKRFDENGKVVGEYRFTGLYTSNVYTESTSQIPVVRTKVSKVLAESKLDPDSHAGSALVHVLETYPRDEVLRLPVEELGRLARGILHMGERRRLRLFVSRDGFGLFVSCLVFLPRDRYTTAVRIGITEAIRAAFHASSVDFTVLVTESVLARLHYVAETSQPLVEVDVDALEDELARIARAWADDLRDALVGARGEEAGLRTFRQFEHAFLPSYEEDIPAAEAVEDIAVLEQLEPAGDLRVDLEPGSDGSRATFKLFRSGPPLVLSDVMPSLEHMGFTIVEERPYHVTLPGGTEAWIDAFRVRSDDPTTFADQVTRAQAEALFLGVWSGAVEDDGLNRLVLRARLDPVDVVVVRGLCKYLRQAGVRFTEAYVADTLVGNPSAAHLLVELFHARVDPPGTGRARPADMVSAELAAAIDGVESLDEDRILRALHQLVAAVVRTNIHRRDPDGTRGTAGVPWLALKLDARALEFLPDPRPQHEIWVCAPEVEGVHLRAGDIARGGVRWSDRREDFRTEVLGLMKAQTVKNAVIVPVGAKGGFVVKRGEAIDCYRTFVRGLLDVTDNLVDGKVVGPPGVVRLDADDPYLVVAADKGTATFSDTANEIAAEYGYWLGDAFASGGSSGYDHKAMGITARGVWVAVRAHFRALGIDADTAPLTVTGIGDMSGDVFGNGLLQSRHVRLVAAFDHRHVFIDPDPDAEQSFEERRRLFELPRSSWADYDATVISRGGGVYLRTAKGVEVSPEAAVALGIEPATLTPDELVRAILRAPVDLLLNGGIGTYVKASTESHQSVGDRANDDRRVDAAELRCRVVAEGGNLGLTQRARVEYALAGGRVNTDSIDNSAGVDMSDHEVNIKILLQSAIASGALERDERDPLLRQMADEVAGLVLADNEAQANALEIAAVESAVLVGVHARQMDRLEMAGHLDRELEALPNAKALQERHAAGRGLTAPELAVLLSYTKLDLARELLASDVPEDPYVRAFLVEYFPTALRERFSPSIDAHALRREIVSTVVANVVVNRAGISFLSRLCDETGHTMARLARAHLVAIDVFDVPASWTAIDDLDLVVEAGVQDAMFLAVRRMTERAARLLVQRREHLDIGATVERYQPAAARLAAALPDLLAGSAAERRGSEVERLQGGGVPAAVAAIVAGSEWLPAVIDIVDLATEHGEDAVAVGGVHFALADALRLDWLRERIAELPRGDRWQTEARAALRDDLHDGHRALAAAVITSTPRDVAPRDRVRSWVDANPLEVQRFLQVLADVEATGVYDLTTLNVARRELRELGSVGP